jgi:hypothetical protein
MSGIQSDTILGGGGAQPVGGHLTALLRVVTNTGFLERMETCPADVLEELLCIFTTGRFDVCLFSSVPPNCRLWVLDVFLERGDSKPFF